MVPPLTTPAMTIALPELSAISVPELVTVPLSLSVPLLKTSMAMPARWYRRSLSPRGRRQS